MSKREREKRKSKKREKKRDMVDRMLFPVERGESEREKGKRDLE